MGRDNRRGCEWRAKKKLGINGPSWRSAGAKAGAHAGCRPGWAGPWEDLWAWGESGSDICVLKNLISSVKSRRAVWVEKKPDFSGARETKSVKIT